MGLTKADKGHRTPGEKEQPSEHECIVAFTWSSHI